MLPPNQPHARVRGREETPNIFRPTKGRLLFAVTLAVVAFSAPQEVPLEWHPLNHPSSGLRYLEITCAANTTGSAKILLQSARSINDLDTIAFPLAPSERAFTYTFPLADAPLRGLRLEPIDTSDGELRITNFRLINRRGEELRRFTKDSFTSLHGSLRIEPTADGWKMVSGSSGGWAEIDFGFFSPPEGMNERNLKRCLLSTSYLALMLWIILLAAFFAFRTREPWRKTVSSMAYLAFLALCFAPVGNRGLIRDSIRFWDTEPPPASSALALELDVNLHAPSHSQLFWDAGQGFREEDSVRLPHPPASTLETLRFPLPETAIRSLRLDPLEGPGRLDIRRIRIVDGNGDVRLALAPDSFEPANQIARLEAAKESIHDVLHLETTPDANDPVLVFKPDAFARINAVLSAR